MKSTTLNRTVVVEPFRSPRRIATLDRRSFVKRLVASSAVGLSGLPFALFADGFSDVFESLYQPAPHLDDSPVRGPRHGLDSVRRWNQIALDAIGLDHTPVAPGENRIFGEQRGPCRASRALAIVHIAMFDTINAVLGEYQSYT